MMLPFLPPLLQQTSGCVLKVPHEQSPSTLCRAGVTCYDMCRREQPFLASVKTAERERDLRLSDSSDTRIPTG